MIHRYPLIALLIVPFLSGTMAYTAPGNPKVATQAPRHLPDLCEMFGDYSSGDHSLQLTATGANTLTLSGNLTPTVFVKPTLLLEAHAPTETADKPTDNDETSLETVDALIIEPEDALATALHEGADEIDSTLSINETLPLAVFTGAPKPSSQNGEIPSGYRHDLADHASLTLFRDDHGMHFIEW